MEELGPYFRVKKTQLELVRDRGFPLLPVTGVFPEIRNFGDETEVLNFTREQFWERYGVIENGKRVFYPGNLSQLYGRFTDKGVITDLCFVYYQKDLVDTSFKQDNINHFVRHEEVLRQWATQIPIEIIIIARENVSSHSKEILLTIWNLYRKITIYEGLHKIIANPSRHFLAPQYTKLSDTEKQNHLQGKTRNQIPYLAYNDLGYAGSEEFMDPVVSYYGWSVQDIVRIEREIFYLNFPVHREISYRTVHNV